MEGGRKGTKILYYFKCLGRESNPHPAMQAGILSHYSTLFENLAIPGSSNNGKHLPPFCHFRFCVFLRLLRDLVGTVLGKVNQKFTMKTLQVLFVCDIYFQA